MGQLDEAGGALEQPRSAGGGAGTGRAEWDLLTDGARWSPGLYTIFGRPPGDGPLTLDQLPSWLPAEDQPLLTAAVTGCLVDGRAMDCEFRVLRPDGSRRAVRMAGEPVVDAEGGTVAMWALIQEVDAPVPAAPVGARRAAVPVADRPALVPWPGGAGDGPGAGVLGTLELAARFLPAGGGGAPEGDGGAASGKWYDALDLPGGGLLLSVGDLSGQGPGAAADTATVLGGVRGIALTGAGPGPLLGHLGQLLDRGTQPVLASVLCCRYAPAARMMTWAQAGHPAPLLCRDGRGRALPRPSGTLLGAVSDAFYAERADRLEPGDVLVLHTDGLFPAIPGAGAPDHAGDPRLLALAARLTSAASAAEALRVITEACGESDRAEDACVLVARVRP
ncbi:SpoIIE family protein phosphatase [Streptomyces avicenniae]|uniref:SpoIIE family protein phosphatase n=1 Tax=Streptomyces avicenniae TaxID=500153 RepID=UPI00167CB432|nr:SpoIIE family protein phosphatase [Streptomyces avicenniae]